MNKPFTQKDIDIKKRETLHQGFFMMERVHYRHRLFAGDWSPMLQREHLNRPDASGVLLYDPERDAIAFVEQCRIGALNEPCPWLLELVAGIVEPGETPQDVAIREAKEEADCDIKALLPIYSYLVSPGGTCEKFHLFCGHVDARTLGGCHGLASEDEDIRVVILPWSDALKQLDDGLVSNSATLIALQWLVRNKQTVCDAWLPA